MRSSAPLRGEHFGEDWSDGMLCHAAYAMYMYSCEVLYSYTYITNNMIFPHARTDSYTCRLGMQVCANNCTHTTECQRLAMQHAGERQQI